MILSATSFARDATLYSYDILGVKLGMSEAEARSILSKNLKKPVFEEITLTSFQTGSPYRGGFWAGVELTKEQDYSYSRSKYGIRLSQSVAVNIANGKVFAISRYLSRMDAPILLDDLIKNLKTKYPEAGFTTNGETTDLIYDVDSKGKAFKDNELHVDVSELNQCHTTPQVATDSIHAAPARIFIPNCSGSLAMNIWATTDKVGLSTVNWIKAVLVDSEVGMKNLKTLDLAEKERLINKTMKTKGKVDL